MALDTRWERSRICSMESRPQPSWLARIALLGIYVIWVATMVRLGSMETKEAGIAAGTLLVLIWMPYDIYRKRHEWLVWLPMHIAIAIAAAVTITLLAEDAPIGTEPGTWVRPLQAAIGGVFWAIQLFTNGVMERRAAERMKAFIEERRTAPKQKPVARFAGRPGAEK
jgi:hypothetical protein